MKEEKRVVEGILGRLVITVHAMFLASGFVVSGRNGSRLRAGWVSGANTEVSIPYTVPDLEGLGGGRDEKVAILKLAVMGTT